MRRLRLSNPLAGTVYYRAVTGSTMDDTRRLATRGASPGTVVVAGHQRSGRGRSSARGPWLDSRGSNLLCSILFDAESTPVASLPLRLGVAAAAALGAHSGLAVATKWPNDLMLSGRKVAGILCERYDRWVIAGVGINCNQRRFPENLAAEATSIRLHTGVRVDLRLLLAHLLRQVAVWVQPDADWLAAVNSTLHWRGQTCQVVAAGAGGQDLVLARGRVEGVDAEGGLVLGRHRATAGSLRLVTS